MPAGFRQVPAAGLQFGVDVLEREVGRVNLAVRVRVADANDFSLVLEDEDERHIGICGQFTHLLLPRLQQRVDAIDLELGERHVVTRAVADDPGHAAGRAVPVDAGGRRQLARSPGADTRMIVVEDVGTAVDRIHRAADPRVPRTEVAGRIECRWFGRGGGDLGAGPGAQLPVCRDDDPLLTQRMPALLPHRPEMLSSARGPDRRATGAVRLGRAPAHCLPRGVAPDPATDPRSSVSPRRPIRRRAASRCPRAVPRRYCARRDRRRCRTAPTALGTPRRSSSCPERTARFPSCSQKSGRGRLRGRPSSAGRRLTPSIG